MTLVDYPSSCEGVLQSFKERWSIEEAKELDEILDALVKRDLKHFGL